MDLVLLSEFSLVLVVFVQFLQSLPQNCQVLLVCILLELGGKDVLLLLQEHGFRLLLLLLLIQLLLASVQNLSFFFEIVDLV